MKKQLKTDDLIEYKGQYYTGTDIKAMREWIADCEWPDLSPTDIKKLTNAQVLIGIKRNFEGGIPAFIATIN